jgi:Alr-MurF fusion protein
MKGIQNHQIFFNHLAKLTGGKLLQLAIDFPIVDLTTDSRKAIPTKNSLFFAFAGTRHDGHQFIHDLYLQGCRQFVVEKDINLTSFPEGNFLLVGSSIKAIQQIASFHRSNFSCPVIGITGSNGKTIVKEWLYQLLSPDFYISKNPGSYNSQLGVPLSVWQMSGEHTMGIFEAGISKPDEMKWLAKVIQPTIGIFTNLLAAHDEGFESRIQKAKEKALLFSKCQTIIYCKDHDLVDQVLTTQKTIEQKLFSWGYSLNADVLISKISNQQHKVTYQGVSFVIEKNFSDAASWENLFHCLATLIWMGYDHAIIAHRIEQLKALPMRLEMKEGIKGNIIVDDSYSNDLAGLKIALDFLKSQQNRKSEVILSDMLESGLEETEWIDQINQVLMQHKVDRLLAIGPKFTAHADRIKIPYKIFHSVEDLLIELPNLDIENAAILIKGARIFRMERIVKQLQKKIHGTVLEINLGAVAHNLNVFRAALKPTTKIMAMVKAFAYGSGSHEVASLFQYHKVDYLGVAYTDEGKLLRSHGMHLPIMVMNPTPDNFRELLEFKLEPSVYSLSLLRSLISHSTLNEISIHLKLDTGMHRLGIEPEEVDELVELLTANPNIKVKSIYSHLAGSDEPQHDQFSAHQAALFSLMADRLEKIIKQPTIKHILNSAGASRLPQYQFDMVRLGIGLYGIDPGNQLSDKLETAVTLRATISQIKTIKPGETVGYGRHGKNIGETKLATVSIGYADGYSRAFSRGVGKVLVNGKLAPVLGNVCMDMTMVDITGIEAREGDEVTIFGEGIPITEIASWINTIPYEVLTSTSDRVKRVFFAESI